MTDIATISLKVNTADLERGEQKLKSFQGAAEKVEKASSNLEGGLKKVSLASLSAGSGHIRSLIPISPDHRFRWQDH